MRMAFFFDQSRCMGCNACTVACKDYYDVNPGPVRYRKQLTHEADDGIGGFYSLVMSCNHCERPACVTACGAAAISKREDGIVVVDRSKCADLRDCIKACPFAEPGIADDKQEPANQRQETWQVAHPMQKCNMCVELLDKGETPICLRACPAHAIEVGDYDELKAKHPDAEPLTLAKYPYAWLNKEGEQDTGPSMLVKPRKKLKITGNYK
jgi:anaerobic dimethyl sulfoxide reductase subunit B (iron-sulfur subunit)